MFNLLQKVRAVILIIICLVFAILFTALAFPRFERIHWYRQFVVTLAAPPLKAITSSQDFVSGIWNHYIAITEASKENELLKARLEEANKRLIEEVEIKNENDRLHKLLEMSQSLKLGGVGAHVISSDPKSEFRTITIDKGYSDGIRKNMVVISYGGLVGKVALVSSNESVVLLVSDPNSAVDVFVQRSGARAILTGTFQRTELGPFYSLSRMEYLRRTSDIREEDVIVTSGLDRLFPVSIPVGSIYNVRTNSSGVFKDADVVPFVDFTQLKEVMVIR